MLATIAFCLPGSALPDNDWFAAIHLDKWIHIGLFAVMIVLWIVPIRNRGAIAQSQNSLLVYIVLACMVYGVCIEFVQHYFVANRSFDIGDIVADAIGCAVGVFLFKWLWKP